MATADVLILGAGASGLFCAALAGRRGRRVVVLDHAPQPGRKLLASGGGRCNITNRQVAPEHYLSDNPHFCRSALARFRPGDLLARLAARGIAWEERTHGRLFLRDSARQILDLLVGDCSQAGVELVLGATLEEVGQDAGTFRVATSRGTWNAPRLVIATGGRAWPGLGATGVGYDLARQFGHGVVETAPALAPLILPPQERLTDLSGISVEATLAIGKTVFRDQLLFTHEGISGPAALQISSYWRPGASIAVDLLPGQAVGDLLTQAQRDGVRTHLANHLSGLLPRRLLHCRLPADLANRPVVQLTPTAISAVTAAVQDWHVSPSGLHGGWDKAEVARGGIDTRDLSSKTMESRLIPGLFCIGEVMDVTGWLGGYNLHWAWASGHAAGLAV